MTAASNALPPPARPAADPSVVRSIRQASRTTNADFGLLMAEAAQESGFRADAKASQGSATGLFQFIESTWLDMVRRYGEKHGLGALAQAVTTDGSGRPTVADPATRQRILALRKDPAVAAALAGEYTQANRQEVERALGRTVNRGELYLAHFLGAGGATQLMRAVAQDGAAPAADLLPEAAAANRAVFYDAAGAPRSVGDIYRDLTGRIERQARDFGQDLAALTSPGDAAGLATATAPPSLTHSFALGGLPMSEPMAQMLNIVALAALKLAGRSDAPGHLAPPRERWSVPL